MAKAIPVSVFGVSYPSRSAACKAFGHSPSKIDHRMRLGATLERALSEPDTYQDKKLHASYAHWNAIRSRCYSKSDCSYRYKKKLIKMCPAWKDDFWAFAKDMGEPPEPGMSIDRIDNDGNYEPSNCRWATRKQQQRNTRSNRHITILSETKLLVEWSEISGLHAATISERIKRGMPPEIAITERTRKGTVSRISFDGNKLVYKKIQKDKNGTA